MGSSIKAATLTAGTFVGGVISTCFFQGLPLNKEDFKILAFGGLQGTLLVAAIEYISRLAGKYAETKSSWKTAKQNQNAATQITYLLCVALIPVIAKTLTDRLGTPTEALTNFAVSGVFGLWSLQSLSKRPKGSKGPW